MNRITLEVNHRRSYTDDNRRWLARVWLTSRQALICFEACNTVGIGFKEESDGNTHLPYVCNTSMIYEHIKHNRKGKYNRGKLIRPDKCKRAIKMLQDFAKAWICPSKI